MPKSSTEINYDKPWNKSLDEIVKGANIDLENGLQKNDVDTLKNKFGKNRLKTEEEKSIFEIIIDQFNSLIILLLAVSAIISFIFGDIVEGFAIVAVIFINAAIGFFTELRAVRSMEALKALTKVTTKVLRDGRLQEINAEEIVPKDILIFDGGDVITADARLIETSNLMANESALTGESLPVPKNVDPLPGDTPLADRSNMVYKGTSISRGSGRALVIATGMDTELGNISSLVQEAEDEATPLQERLDSLGEKLIYISLGLALIVAITGWLSGNELSLMIKTAIALAIASIPEGLPIVATIALARGMRKMAERNALINKLSSVETLGATNVILTDKTGTLTENQMTVTNVILRNGEVRFQGEGLELAGNIQWKNSNIQKDSSANLMELLKVGILCNDASLTVNDDTVEEAIGEPMEIALKIAGQKIDLTSSELDEDYPEVRKISFEQATKMMATVHSIDNDKYLYAVKGSPNAVIDASSKVQKADEIFDMSQEDKKWWRNKNRSIANRGLRVIAVAKKKTQTQDEDPYQNLTLLGLVGLMDPPREEVRKAIQRCKIAGIKVIMATGDHGETAKEIAQAVGLIESADTEYLLGKDLKDISNLSQEDRNKYINTKIFARVNPEQKLELIQLHQENNAIVAMTGDGVNDAPALKKADIGIAMGQRGTQVAKEAADMVLEDDFFGTIVTAIEQGRTIFNNIRKFVLYLLSCNISEIMVVTLATIFGMPLPVLPLQILFLNLVTDVFPALALGMGEGSPRLMSEPPRDAEEPIMTQRHWVTMGVYGALITASVLLSMNYLISNLGFQETQATTISFLILATAQLWHVFNMRENGSNLIKNSITSNKFVWIAIFITLSLLFAAVFVPFLANLLSLEPPSVQGWLVVLIGGLVPMLIGQGLKKLDLIL
jgi:Ca2+-transporting ATPase